MSTSMMAPWKGSDTARCRSSRSSIIPRRHRGPTTRSPTSASSSRRSGPEGTQALDRQHLTVVHIGPKAGPSEAPSRLPGGSMTKADLVEQVTAAIARTSGPMISKKDCARVVDAFLDAVKEALRDQQNIEVRGFGTFKLRRRKTRMAGNPRTGEPVA